MSNSIPNDFYDEMEAQRRKLRQLHQAGKLSEERLMFFESKLDQAINKVMDVQERAAGSSEQGAKTRSNVITVRLSDEALRCLDDMVSVQIAQSRSEAASMLIAEGIRARSALFDEIKKHTEQMEAIRLKLIQTIQESGFGKQEPDESSGMTDNEQQ